jgi:hypothetical protein
MSATQKQIETLNSLVNEINTIAEEAKASANYEEFSHLIERALLGVLVCNDGGGTMVDTARKSNDRALYSTTISLLIRTKQRVQNIVDSWN